MVLLLSILQSTLIYAEERVYGISDYGPVSVNGNGVGRGKDSTYQYIEDLLYNNQGNTGAGKQWICKFRRKQSGSRFGQCLLSKYNEEWRPKYGCYPGKKMEFGKALGEWTNQVYRLRGECQLCSGF